MGPLKPIPGDEYGNSKLVALGLFREPDSFSAASKSPLFYLIFWLLREQKAEDFQRRRSSNYWKRVVQTPNDNNVRKRQDRWNAQSWAPWSRSLLPTELLAVRGKD